MIKCADMAIEVDRTYIINIFLGECVNETDNKTRPMWGLFGGGGGTYSLFSYN